MVSTFIEDDYHGEGTRLQQMLKRIGFVSTRFAGTDGVTLESGKWAEIFEQNGHSCFWFAGKLDHGARKSLLVSEAFSSMKKTGG